MNKNSIWKFRMLPIGKGARAHSFYYPTEYDRYKEFRDSRFFYEFTSLPSLPLHR